MTLFIFSKGETSMNILNFFKRKKRKPNKRLLSIEQINDKITLRGGFQKENYYVTEVWLFNRNDNEIGYLMDSQKPSNNFSFNIHFNDVLKLTLKDQLETFDWYFKVRYLASEVSEKRKLTGQIEYVTIDGEVYMEYFIRCGRFYRTYFNDYLTLNNINDSVVNFTTIKGNLSVIVNGEPESPTKIQIDKMKSKKSHLKLEGKLFTRNSIINDVHLNVRGRDTGVSLQSNDIQVTPIKEAISFKYGLNRYNFHAKIDLVKMNNNTVVPEDIYDIYMGLDLHDNIESKEIRVGRPTKRAQFFLKEYYKYCSDQAIIANPYFTFKQKNLSLEVYNYSKEAYKYLRRLTRFSWLIRLWNKRKKVWLVGERNYKAQDTGYRFFEYMREKYPDRNVYYVIDKDSPEATNVEELGNVIDFKSKEHIFQTVIAEKVISSHHPDYLYPLRTPRFKKKIKADKVFLQHGVMGTKNMVANYGKNAAGFDTDLFMVSSFFEKNMIVNDFGYNPQEVFVTGLSRFDRLFQQDTQVKRQILIIPTWRDWILSDEAFLESDYFHRYKQLINHPRLRELAIEYDCKVLFCLHPNMQKYSSYFYNDFVEIINQGEVSVQALIKESALMITDYSSVAFDFSFLQKPIIYYQFDRNRFLGRRPSHLDLDNDLPGDIVFDEDMLLISLHKILQNNMKMDEEYIRRADKFVTYKDQGASERIYQVIKHNTVKRSVRDNKNYQLIANALYNRFRKSKWYFPVMKKFYAIGKRIVPVDNNLIFFESGVGKQYGDSPRNIYEEIMKQDLNYKKVWAYNKQHRFIDENTKKVKRLSPQYYYYLLRAKYWVNNQNFPTYIEKRKETIYLQTWHGTPLKKMLFDIDNIQGRSDDYLERVGSAIQNWDYLLSPSQYATSAFRSAFHFNKDILETGYPRNDIFYQGDNLELLQQIKNRLQLPKDKKIILYAPTFRDNQTTSNNNFLFDIQLDLDDMKQKLGEEYIILLRMHVVIKNKLNIDEELDDFVYDVSDYPDMQELLLLSDMLITDYSSAMFDFANTLKPMLFFTYDLEEYRDNTRGFYMNFEKEAPGPLLFNSNEVIESIKNIDDVQEEYQSKYQAFYNKYCELEDGKASERVIAKVFN